MLDLVIISILLSLIICSLLIRDIFLSQVWWNCIWSYFISFLTNIYKQLCPISQGYTDYLRATVESEGRQERNWEATLDPRVCRPHIFFSFSILTWHQGLGNLNPLTKHLFFLVSLFSRGLYVCNIKSLNAHFVDFVSSALIDGAEALCLQETWLLGNDNINKYAIPGYISIPNSVQRGRGIITYVPEGFYTVHNATRKDHQITMVELQSYNLLNIYRSSMSDCMCEAWSKLSTQRNALIEWMSDHYR